MDNRRAARCTDVGVPSAELWQAMILTQLRTHPLFHGLEPEALGRLCEGIPMVKVRKGTLLNAPGTDRGRLYLVLSGQLRAYQVTADGRQLLLELITAGGFDGLLATTGRRGHFTEAGMASTVAELALGRLESLIASQPRIASNFLQMTVDRLERRENHLETVVLNDPDRRLASRLLALAETLGRYDGDRVVLDPRITHQMLADMLGVRRETVTIHLRRLATCGAVLSDHGRLSLDLAALNRIVTGRGRRARAA